MHSLQFNSESISFRPDNISCLLEFLKWRINLIIFKLQLLQVFGPKKIILLFGTNLLIQDLS